MFRLLESGSSFERRIVVVEDLLSPQDFFTLRETALNAIQAKRVHIPLHKRGSAVSYHDLIRRAPDVADFYHSHELRNWCSSIVGEQVYMTRCNDLSSCSLLIYDRPGDHIRPHYDLNFYRGRHFTLLLPLVNTNAAGGLSSAQLFYYKGVDKTFVPTAPNSLVLFEGALVRHGVTPLKHGECRIVLSMTYCANPSASRTQKAQRRFKDIAYFGLRALWTSL